MNCRYCGGIYAAKDRTCGGCGSPKTMRETLLDVPAAPGHWSNSMMKTVQWVLIISGITITGAVGLTQIGLDTIGFAIVFFWILPLSPMALLLAAWQSSKENLGERARNIVIAVLIWAALVLVTLAAIGMTLDE